MSGLIPSITVTIAERGPKGDPGTVTVQTTIAVASIVLSGHRAVVQQADGTFIYDDSTVSALARSVPSITTDAAAAGDTVTAILFGYVTEPSWSWTPSAPIFLGQGGLLTQTVPSLTNGDLFSLQLGVAVTATMILWSPQSPIVLA